MDPSLLQPTLVNAPARPHPWRLGSIFWVAFFGGILPATTLLWLNAERLGAAARKRNLVLLFGAIALAAYVGVAVWTGLHWEETMASDSRVRRRVVREASRVLFVIGYLAQAHLLREDDRRHETFDGDYASLWGPGLAAVLVLGSIQAAAFLGIVAALR